MKHPYTTDKKYKWGAIFLACFITAMYLSGPPIYGHIALAIFSSAAIIGYFKMKK